MSRSTPPAVVRHPFVEDKKKPWQPQSGTIPRERATWQALYTVVGSLKLATAIGEEMIIWPQSARPPDKYLRRWALEVDEGSTSPDAALEKLMRQKVEAYKQNRHWQFIDANIRAAMKITDQIEEKGEAKQPIALSYLGANANYGMDKGEHATKQATQQQFNMGNVRIVSARSAPPIKPAQTVKAKKLLAPIEADFRAVEESQGRHGS